MYVCIYICVCLWENLYLEHQNIMWESFNKLLYFNQIAFVQPKHCNLKHNRRITVIPPPDLLRNLHIIYPAGG